MCSKRFKCQLKATAMLAMVAAPRLTQLSQRRLSHTFKLRILQHLSLRKNLDEEIKMDYQGRIRD